MIPRRGFLGRLALAATAPAALGWGRIARANRGFDPADGLAGLRFNREVAAILVEIRRQRRRFPGMVAAILRGNGLIGIAADGVRKFAAPERVEVTDQVHLGSCTKAMTATMIASVVDSGKLRWDSTLASIFPDAVASLHADYRAVTLDQLLHHTAGLPADVAWNEFDQTPTTLGRRAILTGELREAPTTAPGSTFEYSNLGYCLAALMAETVTADSWEGLIRRTVFDPLGMTSAGFGPPGTEGQVDQPWGHLGVGPLYVPVRGDNPPVMGPAGTVHVTLEDWAKFAAFHLGDGATPTGQRLVTAESLAKLHTPDPGKNYAGGWLVAPGRDWSNGPILDHGGSNTMWFAYILLIPGHKFGVLVACNGGGGHAQTACLEVATRLRKLEPTTRN